MSNQPYDNTNSVSLFKNTNKEQDNHPDYSGTLNVDGTEYFVDCWMKEIRNGERAGQKFLSGKVKIKNRQGGGSQGGQQRQQPQQRSQQGNQRPQGNNQNRGNSRYDDLDGEEIPF
jgi:hypothetical protein